MDDNYKYGVNCNVAFVAQPDVSEDGILINPDALERFQFKKYEPRAIDFGSQAFPLNLYDNGTVYTPFP